MLLICLHVLKGKRTADGIVQWMKRRAGPGAPVLNSAESAAQFIDAHNITVVGFFDVCLLTCIYTLYLQYIYRFIFHIYIYEDTYIYIRIWRAMRLRRSRKLPLIWLTRSLP